VTEPAAVARRVALFFLPIALAALYLLGLWSAFPVASLMIGAMVAYLVTPAGAEVVVPVSVFLVRSAYANGGLGGVEIAIAFTVFSIILVDVFIALFLLWNFDLAERAPLLGRFIRKTEEKCRAVIARKRWGERATLAALVTYAALPVQMSGGLVGSLLGRLLGMRPRRVFLAVSLGSAIGGSVVGAIAAALPLQDLQAFAAWVQTWTWTQVAGLLLVVAFVLLILYLYLRGRNNDA